MISYEKNQKYSSIQNSKLLKQSTSITKHVSNKLIIYNVYNHSVKLDRPISIYLKNIIGNV